MSERGSYRAPLYNAYVTTGMDSPDRKLSHRALTHDVLRRLSDRPNASILDVGCGNGSLLDLARQCGYTRLAGVDISPEQVAIARDRGLTNIACEDLIPYLTRTRSTFDAITAVDVIEHFDPGDVVRVLAGIRDALRPGGILILRSPNAEGPFGGRIRYGDLTHGLAFTRSSICQACLAAGYKDVEVHSVVPVVHGVKSGVRFVLWKGIELILQLYLLVETGVTGGPFTQNLIAVAGN